MKVGYGAKVAPFVKPGTVVDITKENRELSPSFLGWLADRKLSSDDRIMRLKEGYVNFYVILLLLPSMFNDHSPKIRTWCVLFYDYDIYN